MATDESKENLLTYWEIKDADFVETGVSKKFWKVLQKDKFVIVTGGPGTGKSFTAQHVLLTIRNSKYDVIPVNSSSDMIRYFSGKSYQIFYIDDFCGRLNILNDEIDEWERNKEKLAELFGGQKIMCIFTCRSQIYSDPKMENLNLKHFKVLDLSGMHQLTLSEKKSVAQQYLEGEVISRLTDKTISDSLCFPLLCSLYKKHVNESIIFFEKPSTYFKMELNELIRKPKKLRYACVALCVLLNNNVPLNTFTLEVSTNIKQMIMNVFEELDINITTPPKTLKAQFDSMVGSYFEKTVSGYKSIHNYLFDIFCSHVSETMIEIVIRYSDSAMISNRALLQSLKQNDESAIFIPEELEQIFFQRVLRDISDGSLVHVFKSYQMKYDSYRLKLMSFLSKTNQKVNIADDRGRSSLFVCSKEGYKDMAKMLCDRGANVNLCDKNGFSPLYVASENGHFDIVDLLCETEGRVNLCNKERKSPLYVASEKGHNYTVELLCENGAHVDLCDKDRKSPLYVASEKGHINMVELLCKTGAHATLRDKDGKSPLYMASEKGHRDIVELLCRKGGNVNLCDKDGKSPLYMASEKGHRHIVGLLCLKGGNVNLCDKDGKSPLYAASENGHIDIVTLLCKIGGNVNLCNKDGKSPLYVVSEKDHIGIVQLLCDRGGDVHRCNKEGRSPLHVASEKGHFYIVSLLCDRGGDVHLLNKENKSPLYFASEKGIINIINFLFNREANVNLCDKEGKTPLYVASENGHIDIVKLLCLRGGKVNLCDRNWKSPQYVASEKGHIDIVDMLKKFESFS